MFETILEYQSLDMQLLKLKRDFENNKEKENLTKYATLIKENQAKLTTVDAESKKAIDNFEKYKSLYAKLLKDYENLRAKYDGMGKEDKEKAITECDSIVSQLSVLERNLSTQVETSNNLIKSFENCKNNIVSYKKLYVASKEKCTEIEKKFIPQENELKQKMVEVEKKCDAKLLAKYKQLRQDKIFPVVVKLNNSSCGGCSMEFSSAQIGVLKEKGYLECEHCRRVNYL